MLNLKLICIIIYIKNMLRIYISSPVSFYQREWNNAIAKILQDYGNKVLLPQDISPRSIAHKRFEKYVYDECINMIQESDLGLLLLPYGRDCAWEAGYYKGLNKPFFAFISELNDIALERLRDWMVKGAISGVITDNSETFTVLKKDSILKNKGIYKIDNILDLPVFIESIMQSIFIKIPFTFVGAGVVIEKGDKVLMIEEQEDSEFYFRRKGMIGFPTITLQENENPIVAARRAIKEEVNICLNNDLEFVTTQNIPGAIGIFYKSKASHLTQISEKAKWIDKEQVLSGKLNLRPTYEKVARLAI